MYECTSYTLSGSSPDSGGQLRYPSKLFVETTSRCNLSCITCQKNPDGVLWPEGDLELATFKSLEGAFGNLESLVLNGTGEPLLNRHLEQFVIRAKRLMPEESWVGFQSNGILLTNMRAISLLDAGVDRICLSMEGVDVATTGTLRSGNQLVDLECALKALCTAKSICGRPTVQVGVEYVVERDNLEELPAALEWAAARGASFASVSRICQPEEGDEPGEEADRGEAQELYQSWKREAEVQGMDITRYFEVLWKPRKTPAEHRLLNLVGAMKGEAQQRGIPLDLKGLCAANPRRENSEEVFERAQVVARRTGLDLKLPDDKRGCVSVEQAGAFISWDGRMLPCYHLWSQCRSGSSGNVHVLQPRIFGNVLKEDILDIWNSAPFRSYRERALRHQTPVCSACHCAYCSPQHRASGVKEWGCSSCLWNSGVFRCLE